MKSKKTKYITLTIPKSWFFVLKKQAKKKKMTTSGIVCNVLLSKFKFKEKRKMQGRPKKGGKK